MQATATANKTVNVAVRSAAKAAAAQHCAVLAVYTDKRTSNKKCNIAGRQIKLHVAARINAATLNAAVTAVKQAVAKYNCTAIAIIKHNIHIKVLRNK